MPWQAVIDGTMSASEYFKDRKPLENNEIFSFDQPTLLKIAAAKLRQMPEEAFVEPTSQSGVIVESSPLPAQNSAMFDTDEGPL